MIQCLYMSSGCTFLLFNIIFIAILLSVWAATVLKELTTFGKYVWTPLSSVYIYMHCNSYMWGNSLWAFSSSIYTCIYFTITVGARFVALFHYFAKCLNLQFVSSSHYYLVPIILHAWKANQAEVIRQVKQTPRNFRFHWLFERYWQGTACD